MKKRLILSTLLMTSQLFAMDNDEKKIDVTFNFPNKGKILQPNSLEDLEDKISNKFGVNNDFSKIVNTKNTALIKKQLKKIMLSYAGNEDKELASISLLATKLFGDFDNLPRQQFQNKASEYFINLGAKDVDFKDKMGGDQLGNRIIVNLKDGQEVTYHAKTHRGGLKSQHSSSSQPVDLKELLIYKILEFSGIGSETHFFYDDIKNFYIATKDVGYDDKNMKQREFLTYEKIRENNSSEELLKNSLIVNGFIKADIISRLLSLSDVINNGGNTGISSSEQFKIIDFNPPVTKEYKNPKVFEDWLSGNNQYNYSDPTVISILKNKSKEEKIESSLYSVKQLDGFDNYIKKSYEVVANYMDKVPGIETFQVEDLNFYTESILENYKLLIEKIYNSNIDF